MAKSAGGVVVNFTAGTATFLKDVELANGSVRSFGKNTQSSMFGARTAMISASTAIKELEGNFTGSSRAVARLLIDVGGLGKVMAAAFPVLGALAFVGVLAKIGEGVHKFFKDMEEAPKKIEQAFSPLHASLQVTNDELRIANDRLEIDIAKLEGKRVNNLKLALDEATKAADLLAQSLEKDMIEIEKIIEKNKPGFAQRWFFGVQGTDDLEKNWKAFETKIHDIDEEQRTSLRRAQGIQNPAAQQKAITDAQAKGIADRKKAHDDEITYLTGVINTAKAPQPPTHRFDPSLGGYVTEQHDNPAERAARLATANALRQYTEDQADRNALTAKNQALTVKDEGLKAKKANELLERPFENRLALLTAQLEAAQEKLSAIGMSQAAQDAAKAQGLLGLAVTEVNKQLKDHHTQLTAVQIDKLKDVTTTLVQVESVEKWRASLNASNLAAQQRINSLSLLSEAIGKGYEATKKANVETGLAAFWGEHAADAEFKRTHAAEGALKSAQLAAEFDAQHAVQIKETVEKLEEQIAVERAVNAVVTQGSYAMQQAALSAKILQLQTKENATNVEALTKAMKQLFDAQQKLATDEQVQKLKLQTAGIKAVTAAILQGAEAERKAANEAKYAEMDRADPSKKVSDQARQEDEARHQEDLLRDATHITMEHVNRIQRIDEEIKLLDKLYAKNKDDLQYQIARRNLENERLEQLSKENLQVGTLKSGWAAFVQEMSATIKKPGQILYESLTDALSRVSDAFSKLITGQKVSIGKLIQDLGASILRNIIQEGLKQVIKIVFGKTLGAPDGSPNNPFTVQPPTGKPDGSSDNPLNVFVTNQPDSGTRTDTSTSAGGKILVGVDPSVSGKSGTIGGGGHGSALAEGGSVAPGGAYLVGERGPEPFFPQVSGQVMSNSMAQKTFGSGGHTYFMSIDARGTDPAQTEQRVYRAIREAHRDAIGTSVQATVMRNSRVPAGK
jgi:hypothetical protein